MSSGGRLMADRESLLDDRRWESHWLIERPTGVPHPEYWDGSGWTSDPWKARRYATQQEGERHLRRWLAHPTVLVAKVVSHGFGSPVGE